MHYVYDDYIFIKNLAYVHIPSPIIVEPQRQRMGMPYEWFGPRIDCGKISASPQRRFFRHRALTADHRDFPRSRRLGALHAPPRMTSPRRLANDLLIGSPLINTR